MSWLRLSVSRFSRNSRMSFAVLCAIPLAVLALAPGAGRAAAHPAAPAPLAYPNGKILGPYVDLTLHYHGTLFETSNPQRMSTDAQGNLYVSDDSHEYVYMFDATNHYLRVFGSGNQGTGSGSFHSPQGIVATGGTVYVADFFNGIIQTFNQSTGTFISQFGSGHLGSPVGMALGTNGTLYVVDEFGDDVAEFSTSGTYLGSFGSFGSGNGQFANPLEIAASPYGPLYVTDILNKNVQEFTLAGSYVTQWGSASFNSPDGIAVDRAGMVYVVDSGAYTVYKFDPNGSLVGDYAAPPTTVFVPGTFVSPVDVAVRSIANAPFNVFISDSSIGLVQQFDEATNPQVHTYQSQWGGAGTGNGQFDHPWNLATDSAGNVYVADSNNNRIEKFDQFGNFLLAWGSAGSGDGQFLDPRAIAITGSSVYVTDNENFRVQEFDTAGTFVRAWGTLGGGNGQFGDPDDIATDGTSVYVTDGNNNRVEVFDLSGNYQAQWGTYGSGNGQFNDPVGIAVDVNRAEVFVADYSNSRIEAFNTFGIYIATFGSGTLAYPGGIATDQRGDVYVADSGNNRIYQFDVNGTVSSTFGAAGSGNGQFSAPLGVAVNPANGQIYVPDMDNNRVERFGSPWPKHDTVGIYRPSTKTFYLRNENTTGPADISVYMSYAQAGDIPVVGDWEGTGVDTVGLYRPSTARFLLQDVNVQESAPDYSFTLGIAGDTPIAGDWNGDGTDGAGIFRPSNGILYLKNSLSTGVADYNLVLGVPGDKGIAGDWNGDGQDSPGVYRPSNQRFYVTNKVTNGVVTSDHSAILGISGDVPFTGDWIAQGFSGIGVFRPTNGVTYEKNTIVTGPADNNFVYGIAGDVPVAGQWVAPSVPFSVPAPHVLLGSHATSAAPRPASGKPGPAGPGSAPVRAPAAAATPSAARHQEPITR